MTLLSFEKINGKVEQIILLEEIGSAMGRITSQRGGSHWAFLGISVGERPRKRGLVIKIEEVSHISLLDWTA